MVKNITLCAGLTGAFCIAAPYAFAQDGGLYYWLDLEQRFEATDNLSLSIPAKGTTTSSTTRLTFGLSAETRTQKFSLTTGTSLRMVDDPGGSDTDFDDPSLNLTYSRESANAELTSSAYFRQSDVDYLRSFDTIIDDDGVITLPDDFDELMGSGTRETYGGRIGLEFGKNAPLGLALAAGIDVTDYSDVTDPDLFDIERRFASATTKLRFSEVTSGSVTLRRSTFEDEDPAGQTERETTSLSFGITHALSEVAELTASIGQSRIETDETVGLVTTRTRKEGLSGDIGLTLDRPNGSINFGIGASTNQDGTRYSANVGRSLDLPDGSISGNLGLTKLEDNDSNVTASLNWTKELPDGNLNARLNRAIRSNNDDDDVLTTTLFLGYSYDVNEVSGLRFNLSYADTDEGATSITQTSLSASYRRALTPDWDMNLGIAHRERDETGVGSADSQSVFLTLTRRFDWQR